MVDPNFWRTKRVLVTGHTGFKGSWLSLWLLSLGANVWGYSLEPDTENSLFTSLQLSSINYNDFNSRFHHNLGDVRDHVNFSAVVHDCLPDVVFHLAAQPLVRQSYRDPLNTWSTNVQGSLNLLDSLNSITKNCAVVMVTTDKVYRNNEWVFGYRETDRLGGFDPYSASKAAAELAISSWYSSFCGPLEHQNPYLRISTARAGNVIGGGDWAVDRILPDAMRALSLNSPICVRSPNATRPWQHVLEPLSGYLCLAEYLYSSTTGLFDSFNFGPYIDSNRSVRDLIETALLHWPGTWIDRSHPNDLHEASRLHLQIDKAYHQLGWSPSWSFETTVERSVSWYKSVHDGSHPLDSCLRDLDYYTHCS